MFTHQAPAVNLHMTALFPSSLKQVETSSISQDLIVFTIWLVFIFKQSQFQTIKVMNGHHQALARHGGRTKFDCLTV